MGSKKQSKLRMNSSFGYRDGYSRLSDLSDRLYTCSTVGLSIMTTRISQWWARYFYTVKLWHYLTSVTGK